MGSFVWLGTESGLLQVFCGLTYKPVAMGFNNYRYILKIIHSAVCNTVLVSFSDGSVLSFEDNITKYNETITQKEVSDFFYNSDRNTKIRKLVHRTQFTGDNKIHCMAGVASHVQRTFSHEIVKFADSAGGIAVTTRDSETNEPAGSPPVVSTEITYELWCGQDKGRITILDINSLRVMKTLPLMGNDLNDPTLKDLKVQFLEVSRTFDTVVSQSSSQSNHSGPDTTELSRYLWVVAYPGTKVARWNVDKRAVEEVFDTSLHSPWHDCKYSSKDLSILLA